MFKGIGLSEGRLQDRLIELVDEGNLPIVHPDLGNHSIQFNSEFKVLVMIENSVIDIFEQYLDEVEVFLEGITPG